MSNRSDTAVYIVRTCADPPGSVCEKGSIEIMEIRESKQDKTLTLELTGELDLTGAPQLTAYIEEHLEGIDALILNMEEIAYMSSAGIRSVLSAYHAMEGKEFRIIGCSDLVYEVFDMTGLTAVLQIAKV